jgi:hypothetical protein
MVMYSGLTRALTCYIDLMNKDFMEYLDKFVIMFISGILVYPKSKEEQRSKRNMKSISVWFCRSFETINYTPS